MSAPVTKAKVSRSTKDCRVCEQYLKDLGRCYFEYNDTGVCTEGDKFKRATFTPLWVVPANPQVN